ncbi:MAG: hypothetical protein VX944_09255 [Myxococcota bacterium]|nr:hypothetical protein [Myxococcota bacterium]
MIPSLDRRLPSWAGSAVAAALGVLVVVQHASWLELHTAVETWDDDAGLFRLALCFASGNEAACSVGAPYPPLVPWISSRLMGGAPTLQGALTSLWPFVVLLMGALYVGVRQRMGTMAALTAMVLGPVMVWSLHIRGKYYTEVPLAALCITAVAALAVSDGLRRRLPSLVFGTAMGLGLLTKWSFAFFLGPVAAVAMALAVRGAVGHPVSQVVGVAGVLAVPAFVLAGAAGWLTHGLTIAVWSGGAVGVFLWRATRRNEEGRHRLANLALMVAAVVAVAGPWYWTQFWSLQEFLTANLSQQYDGDAVDGWGGWPFYPAVLLTRMMGTPAALLFVVGGAMALGRNAPPIVRYAMLALMSGMLILGVLPYRAGRYLIPALGLAVVPMVWVLRRWSGPARWLLPMALAAGIGHHASWIPMAIGGARIPHHLPIFSLPEPDLMGNTQRGIYQAYTDLLRPRWRFLPVANPPVHQVAPSKRLAERIAADSGETPSLTMVVDPASALNLNAMRSHMDATLPPPTTMVAATNKRINAASLKTWQHRARKPRDQPATARGRPTPRRLYVVTAYSPEQGPGAEGIAAFKALGFDAVQRDGVLDGFQPVGLTVWRWTP